MMAPNILQDFLLTVYVSKKNVMVMLLTLRA
jgi:hypothetical protein